jgi:hypothetical protein
MPVVSISGPKAAGTAVAIGPALGAIGILDTFNVSGTLPSSRQAVVSCQASGTQVGRSGLIQGQGGPGTDLIDESIILPLATQLYCVLATAIVASETLSVAYNVNPPAGGSGGGTTAYAALGEQSMARVNGWADNDMPGVILLGAASGAKIIVDNIIVINTSTPVGGLQPLSTAVVQLVDCDNAITSWVPLTAPFNLTPGNPSIRTSWSMSNGWSFGNPGGNAPSGLLSTAGLVIGDPLVDPIPISNIGIVLVNAGTGVTFDFVTFIRIFYP